MQDVFAPNDNSKVLISDRLILLCQISSATNRLFQHLFSILRVDSPSGQNTHAATAEFTDIKRVRESSSTGHCQRNGIAVFFKAKASSTKADRLDPGGSLFKSRWIAI